MRLIFIRHGMTAGNLVKRYLGHSREEYERMIGRDALNVIYEQDRKRVFEAAQKAVESGGVLPFPDGEDTAAFKARCAAAFCRVTEKHAADDTLAFVVHGGTIMSILEAYEPSHTYFGWQCKNGEGYRAAFADGIITAVEAL